MHEKAERPKIRKFY